jgi:hypothetical protein
VKSEAVVLVVVAACASYYRRIVGLCNRVAGILYAMEHWQVEQLSRPTSSIL